MGGGLGVGFGARVEVRQIERESRGPSWPPSTAFAYTKYRPSFRSPAGAGEGLPLAEVLGLGECDPEWCALGAGETEGSAVVLPFFANR